MLAVILAFACCVIPLSVEAQQAPKMYRLGWLQTASSTNPIYRDFIDAMHGLGYVEGKNIEIVVRSAQGQLARLPQLARELVELHPDALFTGADQGLRAAKDATDMIPIVVVVCDPLDALIASIARPGGKATGLTCIASELASKRLQLEMLAEVKTARPNVPVIMITAYGDEETKKKAATLGAAGLLTKPIDFTLLRNEIDRRLERAS